MLNTNNKTATDTNIDNTDHDLDPLDQIVVAPALRGQILVVDDSPLSLDVLTAMLTQKGYTLRSAATGQTALAMAQADPPDLILLDIVMPQMDGYEICRRLVAHPATAAIPVIFMSAADGEQDKVRGFEAGGVDYITKPLQIYEVVARIEHQLNLKRLRQELEEKNRQLSIEIEQRIQVEETLRQQADKERLRASITERVRQSLNLKEILETAVIELRSVLQVDRMLILQLNQNWSGLVVAEACELTSLKSVGWTIRDACFQHWWERAQAAEQVICINDLAACDTDVGYISLFESLQAAALLIVPIAQGENIWGMMMAHQHQPRQWQAWEMELLQQVAGQLAVTIQQAEFYRQTQHFNAQLERQVRARTAELELAFELEAALKRITDKVRDSLDEAQILQTAVAELGRSLQTLCCNAALFDLEQRTSLICYEYTTTLISSLGRISNIDDFPELYQPLLAGQQLQFCSLLSRPGHERLVMLCCPIQDETNRVLGSLWLIKQAYHVFSEQDIRLVQQVANQCAIALRQARLYQDSQAQVQELERLNQLKDDFLSTVSHELRTPMSNIKMATQMLDIVLTRQGVLGETSGQVNRYFEVLRNECHREINLINDLLDLTRLDARTAPLTLHQINLATWLPQVASPFRDRMERQQQTLCLDVPELPLLQTDESFVERILSELINNACKYTPADETILISAQRLEAGFRLSVANSGVEIPAQERRQIFDKFYRVPQNDPWKHGGTGLGLALVKRLVEKLNGTITVTCADNVTTFTVDLPDL